MADRFTTRSRFFALTFLLLSFFVPFSLATYFGLAVWQALIVFISAAVLLTLLGIYSSSVRDRQLKQHKKIFPD